MGTPTPDTGGEAVAQPAVLTVASEGMSDDLRQRVTDAFRTLQDTITGTLERLDGRAKFRQDEWTREGGGGGRTRVMLEGAVFEKAGVNFSAVHGELDPDFAAQLPGEGTSLYATGVSLVLHPFSPLVPTCHANFRYIEKGDRRWFGGGADLTPYYLETDDARHFHRVWKRVCDQHGAERYPAYKRKCDEYFHVKHRREGRGIGGIFFDYLDEELEQQFAFVTDAGAAFLESYVPIVERRRDQPWTEAQKRWQLVRRGRYVEFNLVYDRGTIFGLRTGGRIESILMSLPYHVMWDYDLQPEPGSPEAELVAVLREPREWV